MTVSLGLMDVTPSPTFSTRPTPSLPATAGKQKPRGFFHKSENEINGGTALPCPHQTTSRERQAYGSEHPCCSRRGDASSAFYNFTAPPAPKYLNTLAGLPYFWKMAELTVLAKRHREGFIIDDLKTAMVAIMGPDTVSNWRSDAFRGFSTFPQVEWYEQTRYGYGFTDCMGRSFRRRCIYTWIISRGTTICLRLTLK